MVCCRSLDASPAAAMAAMFSTAMSSLPARLQAALRDAGAEDPGTLQHLLPSCVDDGPAFLAELYAGEAGDEVVMDHASYLPGLRAAAILAAARRKRQLAVEPVEVMVTWAKNRRAEEQDRQLVRYRAEDGRRAAVATVPPWCNASSRVASRVQLDLRVTPTPGARPRTRSARSGSPSSSSSWPTRGLRWSSGHRRAG